MQTLNSPKPVISIQNLDHYFGNGQLRKQVLFNINLTINTGEIVIMVELIPYNSKWKDNFNQLKEAYMDPAVL
jgi:hypothetical protein